MSNTPKPSVVIFAKQVTSMARFYCGVAAMQEIYADKSHVVLDAPQFQLVLHNISKSIAAGIEITEPPRIRDSTPIKLCLPVADIAVARTLAAALGGKIGPKRTEWQARGFNACDGHDPEGNVFQVREGAG